MEKLKALPKLRSVRGGIGRLKRREPALPPIEGVATSIEDLVPPEVADLQRRLGNRDEDRKLAQRVIGMMGNYPAASIPELITLDWLRGKNYPFDFQAALWGGRTTKGGSVPDFVIDVGGSAVVWRVQGEYWHTRPGKRARDATEAALMLGQNFEGKRITSVVDLWENDIYDRRPDIYLFGLSGVGLRD